MVITKEDLHDWNSNPVTVKIFQALKMARQETMERPKVRDTADQTAMQVATDEGFCAGLEAMFEAYEEALDVLEGME